jgi:hypothetical protein
MTQPPPGYAPQQPPQNGNGFVKPLLIGCGVVLAILLVVGGVAAYFTVRAVGSAVHSASEAAGVAQGAVSSAQQAVGDAGASPDPAHAAAAGVAILKGLVNGGKANVQTLSREEIKADLPASVDSLARTSAESSSGSYSGISGTSASANYGTSDQTVSIDVTDAANVGGLTTMMDIAFNLEHEDDSGYEKNVQLGDTKVHEKWQNDGKHSELIGIVGGRFVVDVTGNGVDITEAERAFSAVDAAKLESAAAALPK